MLTVACTWAQHPVWNRTFGPKGPCRYVVYTSAPKQSCGFVWDPRLKSYTYMDPLKMRHAVQTTELHGERDP